MGIKFDGGSITTTLKNLDATHGKILGALTIIGQVSSAKMANDAKLNAKWTDRTSNARQLLNGTAEWVSPSTLQISVAHGVDYGVWLELAMGRKYAILEQSRDANLPEMIKAFKKLAGDIV